MPKMAGFTANETEDILQRAIAFFEDSEQMMGPFFDSVNQRERLCRCLLPEELERRYDAYPDRSSLVPADIYNNINSLRATARAALFSKKPYIKLSMAGRPNYRDERLDKAEQIQQANFDMAADGVGFEADADKAIYQALYAGRSCAHTHWARRWEKVPVRDPHTNQIVIKDGKPLFEQNLVADFPETTSVDIRRVRIDPTAPEVKDIRIVGVQSLQMMSELIALNRQKDTHYKFDEAKLQKSTFQSSLFYQHVKSENETFSKQDQNDKYGDRVVEVWSIRGLFPIFGDNQQVIEWKDLIIEIGNRTELLALKENDLPLPTWKLFHWPAVDEQQGRLFPMGIVEPIEDTFIEAFVKRNQSMDSANRQVYVTWIADSNSTQEIPEYIESSNDQVLKIDLAAGGITDDVRKVIAPLERPALGQDTFEHYAVLKKEMQQGMKLSDYTQGVNPDRTETATAVSELVSGGMSLSQHLIERIVDTYIAPAVQAQMTLWNFFKGDKPHEVFDWAGRKLTVAPGELNLAYRVAVETNLSATDPAMVRRWIESLPMILNDPHYDQRVVREVHNDLLQLPNKERLLPPDELQQAIVDRESYALGYGLELQVHELDNHRLHIELHSGYRELIEQSDDDSVTTEAIDSHIEQHQAYIEQMNEALGNTKAGGGLGVDVQPDAAATRNTGRGSTGKYTPSENRR